MSTNPTMFAGDGEPCASCGSPLASDQRYCLACGRRRADARLPFLEILRGEGGSTEYRRLETVQTVGGPGVAGAVAGGPAWLAQARANTAIIAGVGVLLLAMLIGVLLGSGVGNDNTSTVADRKPVVVSVGGAAPVAAAATTTATDATATDATAAATTKKRKSSSSKRSASSSKATIKPKAVAPAALQNLNKLSGKAYQKQVDKLGKNIATGGKAPPKDNKAPAGGGGFQDIG